MISDIERAKRIIRRHPYTISITTGCKLAQTCIQSNGYVKIKFKKKYVYLHRLVAFVHLELNLLDDSILVLHKRECPHKHCFSEHHLYIGNTSQNADDYVALGKHHERSRTYCNKGHKLDSLMATKRDGLVRYCSICRSEAQTKFKDKILAEELSRVLKPK